MNLEPGAQFGGRYRVDRVLGEGGFAVVYAATASGSGERVALKVLRGPTSPSDRARFEREARIAGRLRSPHVPRLVEFGELPGGPLFAAFELVEGEDLSDLLGRVGRLDSRAVRDIALQLLHALEDAHRAGLVHRDIKPQNIRVAADRERPGSLRATLLDFGIARATDGGHPSVTRTGELIGTPRYMSPEQLTGQRLTPASDIYSLGVVVFEMLAGPQALPESKVGAQLERLVDGHVFQSPALAGGDPDLVAVMRKMTARNPEQRFRSASAVTAALRRQPAEPEPAPVARRSRLRSGVVLGILVALALVIGGVATLRLGDSAPVAPQPKRASGLALVQGSQEGKSRVRSTPEPIAAVADAGVQDTAADPVEPEAPVWREGRCGVPPDWGVMPPEKIRRWVPKNYRSKRRHPVVIALHGDLEGAGQFVHEAKFDRVADAEGFIFVAPFDGEFPWQEPALARARVRHVVELVDQAACIDRDRIFLIGNREGAFPALELACEPWVRAAAIANVGVPVAREGILSCPNPAPVIWFHPTAAPRAPKEGGRDCEDEPRLPLAAVVDSFRARNQCDGEPRVAHRRKDGFCEVHNCRTAFELCEVEGGPFWPGQGQRSAGWAAAVQLFAPGCEMGPATTFPMLEVTWKFFEAQPPRGH